jgi:hypothetical protein
VSIFVSIAAYRDPQLGPTIRDCIAKARYAKDLRFGVCWQHGPEEPEPALPEGTVCRLLDVDWRESRGACWARAEIMRLWEGEDYFFQLDSHHRFVRDWDVKLIDYMRRTNSAKPVLTTYGTPFTPGEHELLDDEPMQMNFDYFTPQAIALFRPGHIENWRRLSRPLRARFISAHFLFTSGEFVRDVPYDPELYFIGEEISLTIRAFTHGYDLFHPPEPIVCHEYTRSYRHKHWEDHLKQQQVETEWHQRDGASVAKVHQFLMAPTVGPFACGTVRSFADYEAYAGLSFKHKRAQDYTTRFQEPPNPPMPADWAEAIRSWRVVAAIDRTALPELALRDPAFWYVGTHDADGQEIYREDLKEEELQYLVAAGSPRILIERRFESHAEPLTWTVWPFSKSAGWLDKIEGAVDGPDKLVASAPRLPSRLALKRRVVDALSAIPFPPAPRLPLRKEMPPRFDNR